MLEVMIPDIYWNNEYWCIKNLKSITELEDLLKYVDGSVKNLIVNVKFAIDVEKDMEIIFNKFKWIDKILVKKQNKLVGIYKRK